jgi:hypothetical protein
MVHKAGMEIVITGAVHRTGYDLFERHRNFFTVCFS